MAIMAGRDNRSYIAALDLTAAQFHFVARDSGVDTVTAAPVGGEDSVVGVLLNTPNTGQAATVKVSGTAMVVCSGTITAGAKVSCAVGGKAKVAATGENILGIAREAGVANQVISVDLIDGGNNAA